MTRETIRYTQQFWNTCGPLVAALSCDHIDEILELIEDGCDDGSVLAVIEQQGASFSANYPTPTDFGIQHIKAVRELCRESM